MSENGGYSVGKVKFFTGMEGQGYNAVLYRDGHKIALVIDDATGGDISFQWEDGYRNTVEENSLLTFLKTLPKWKGYEDTLLDVTPDIFISGLIDAFQTERQIRRWLSKPQTLYRLKGDKEGSWRVLNKPYTPKVDVALKARYGDKMEEILQVKYAHMMEKAPGPAQDVKTTKVKMKAKTEGKGSRDAVRGFSASAVGMMSI